ncbi:MAG: hypothetical protein NWE96_12295 [Candidatus Bathyarchaeota archaeon]|nr:hypothetical protein [Candidatus Bathyarchaeota archaeon]
MGALNRTCTILWVVSFSLLLILPADSSIPSQNAATTYESHYTLLNQPLVVSTPPSLYEYYNNLSHIIKNDAEYAKFITPQIVQPIADTIRNLTQGLPYPEEQFANEVLDFVHQIPYKITGAKYPVETLIENEGDCGAVSLLAASIMKAGGLDVILIKYTATDFAHMNVGVNLPQEPVYKTLFFSSTSVEFNNKTYWTAEATPLANWKVGDQPARMAETVYQVIPIEDCEQTSPGQVSCSLSTLLPIKVSIDFSSAPKETNRSLLIWGTIEPNIPNCNVTIYVKSEGNIQYNKTITDENGNYAFLWNFTKDGTYYISATCSGNQTYAGADSEKVAVLIGPPQLLQFQSETYNYVVGIPVSDIAIRPYMGVKDFLAAPIEVNSSFSYSFNVLSTGQSTSEVKTMTLTLPATEHTIRSRNRIIQTIQVPAKTIVVPENIPPGLQPLALPNDFNDTINNQFCFILKKTATGQYNFTAQGLANRDITALKQGNLSTVFFNATDAINIGEWYTVFTEISKDSLTIKVQDKEGTSQLSEPINTLDNDQVVLIMANNVDSAVALKNFQVGGTTEKADPTTQIVRFPTPPPKSLLFFGVAVVIIAAVMTVTGAAIRVRKSRGDRKGGGAAGI